MIFFVYACAVDGAIKAEAEVLIKDHRLKISFRTSRAYKGVACEITRIQPHMICYENSLQLAVDNNLATVAFPAISTGYTASPKIKQPA